MANKANIKTLDIVQDFKNALVMFGDEVRMAISSAHSDMQRMVNRLKGDYAAHWKQEHKKWSRKLAEAKTDLYRVQLQLQNTREKPIEQIKAVEKCDRHVKEAEWKLNRIKHWVRELEREILLCKGQLQPLDRSVDVDLPRAAARLEQMQTHLEAYINLHAPAAAEPAAPSGESARSERPTMARSHGDESRDSAPAIGFALDAAQRDAVPAATPSHVNDDSWRIDPDDAKRLHELDLPIDPPFPDDTIVVAAGAFDAASLTLHRTERTSAGDSGWLIAPSDATDEPPDPEQCASMTFAQMREAAASLEPLLVLPRGTLVRLEAGRIVELIDPQGGSRWQHEGAS